MIYIEAKKEANTIEVAVTGHSYTNEPGKDLVCCAISTLIQTLAFYLDYEKADNEFVIEEGNSYIKTVLNPKTEIAAEAILFGIEQIAKQYIQYINFKRL